MFLLLLCFAALHRVRWAVQPRKGPEILDLLEVCMYVHTKLHSEGMEYERFTIPFQTKQWNFEKIMLGLLYKIFWPLRSMCGRFCLLDFIPRGNIIVVGPDRG